MLSVIIATSESERPLVRSLAALVPGATAGLVREVIIADGGSADGTAEVADFAGCRLMVSDHGPGHRLKEAAAAARAGDKAAAADLFLRAGRSAAAQGDKADARVWLRKAASLAPRQGIGRDAADLLRGLTEEGR